MSSWPHWLPLVIALPVVSGAVTPALSLRHPRVAPWWSLATMAVTLTACMALTLRAGREGAFAYAVGGWAAPYGIELRFDEFSAVVIVIGLVASLALAFSLRYAEQTVPPGRLPYYYTLLLLNVGGMIGFVVTADLFNLFVFLELLSLSAYGLVAVGGSRVSELAAFKALLMGAVSSVVILFSIGLVYALTGTLNMADVTARLATVDNPVPVAVAFAGLTVGFLVKAGVFPLHVWLPDAHSTAPSPVSAVLSGLVVKMGVVGLIRVHQIAAGAGTIGFETQNLMLLWLGGASLVMGAFFAIFQEDIKLMLAYSTISNVGYIVLGLALMSTRAVMGASVHVLNHAIIKATLFLAAGALIHQTGCRTLRDLRGVGRSMPLTGLAMSVGILAIIGIPPTNGFLSKWYIALGAVEAGKPTVAFVLVFGALLMTIYYVRMLNAFYFRDPTRETVVHAHEAPWSMLVPVLLLAVLCLVMGILGRIPLAFLEPAVRRLVHP